MKGGRDARLLRLSRLSGLLLDRLLLDVESDVENITVLNLVGLAFEPLEAASRGLRV